MSAVPYTYMCLLWQPTVIGNRAFADLSAARVWGQPTCTVCAISNWETLHF